MRFWDALSSLKAIKSSNFDNVAIKRIAEMLTPLMPKVEAKLLQAPQHRINVPGLGSLHLKIEVLEEDETSRTERRQIIFRSVLSEKKIMNTPQKPIHKK